MRLHHLWEHVSVALLLCEPACIYHKYYRACLQVMAALARYTRNHLGGFSAEHIALTMRGFGALGYKDPQLWQDVAEAILKVCAAPAPSHNAHTVHHRSTRNLRGLCRILSPPTAHERTACCSHATPSCFGIPSTIATVTASATTTATIITTMSALWPPHAASRLLMLPHVPHQTPEPHMLLPPPHTGASQVHPARRGPAGGHVPRIRPV